MEWLTSMDNRQSRGTLFVVILYLVLVWESGALSWVVAGGALVGVVSYWMLRDGRSALVYGGIATLVISAFGVAALLSPGWYESVLDSIL